MDVRKPEALKIYLIASSKSPVSRNNNKTSPYKT